MKLNVTKKISGIYAICDIHYSSHTSHLKLAKELLEGGIQVLQLRMKGEKNDEKVRETALNILELKKSHSFTFILNDFVNIAAEIPCDGVHVGQDDLDIAQSRNIVGPNVFIGYSSHSLEEAITAEKAGADYVALGAIFPTSTKGPGHPVVGIHTLKKVVETLQVPVVAIGGINKSKLPEVLSTGVNSVAMITALTQAQDVTQASRDMIQLYQKNQNHGAK